MSEKIAVVLLNLGGPDCPAAIEPFLRNFFSDKNIINLPAFLRLPLARIIASRRAKGEAHESYMALGGKSPLLENTLKQRIALENVLNKQNLNAQVFLAMRYWHPRTDAVVKEIMAYVPDKIILLPLYPQYSTATTKSSFEEIEDILFREKNPAPVLKIHEWPENTGFIKASCHRILEKIGDKKDYRLLFSAHGLPKRTIEKGDPYQRQAENTAKAIARELDIPDLDWVICYQSRVGPLEWIGPSIEEELIRAGQDKKGVIVYPHAFVSEHVETLVELDQMYKEKAEQWGVPFYLRALTVGTDPDFIMGLAELVRNRIKETEIRRA